MDCPIISLMSNVNDIVAKLFPTSSPFQAGVASEVVRPINATLLNPDPLGCVQNRIQIGGFGTVRVKASYS